MIKRNLILGFGFCVLYLLQVITITKIDKVQNNIDVEKIYKDEIFYSSIKEKRFNRKEGTFSPITIQKDNPEIPYDNYISSEQVVTKNLQGTYYNSKEEAGVAGQNPPVYSEMSNITGTN